MSSGGKGNSLLFTGTILLANHLADFFDLNLSVHPFFDFLEDFMVTYLSSLYLQFVSNHLNSESRHCHIIHQFTQQQKVLKLELALWRHFVNTGLCSWQEVKSPLGNQFQWPVLVASHWSGLGILACDWSIMRGAPSHYVTGVCVAHHGMVLPSRRNFEPSLGAALARSLNKLYTDASEDEWPSSLFSIIFKFVWLSQCQDYMLLLILHQGLVFDDFTEASTDLTKEP